MTYFISYHAKTPRGDFGFGNQVVAGISMNTEDEICAAREIIRSTFLRVNPVGAAQITIINFIPIPPEATTSPD